MASNNIGKTFEQEFKECVPPDYYLYRLKDDTSGFYGVSNPCDYILFRSPYLFMVELKTHKGKSIPIAKIRPNQIQGMEKATHYEGVYGGFLINFRELEETYYIREKKGYTLKDVVKGTGYTEVSISRWETGTRIPKATVLYNLAKFYGVSVDRFFWK